MNQSKYKKLLPGSLYLALSAAIISPIESAQAAPLWTGTANYTSVATTDGDEQNVGPFNEYHFGKGVLLTSSLIGAGVGSTVTGWFQTSVDSHKLLSLGIDVSATNLSTFGSGTGYSGTGDGYELTLVSRFTTQIASVVAGNYTFDNVQGTTQLYFDTNPNYNFAGNSGFEDGNLLMSGTVVAGSGSAFLTGSGFGAGEYGLDFTGSFNYFNPLVYSPAVGGGDALFSMSTKVASIPAGVTQVLNGTKVAGSLLASTTGTLTLTAVPVPAAVWLFGSALIGWTSMARRKAFAA